MLTEPLVQQLTQLRLHGMAQALERQIAALGYQAPQNALTHLAALTSARGRRGPDRKPPQSDRAGWQAARHGWTFSESLRRCTRGTGPDAID